ncbi:hypothetical protein BPORC_1013 [Bifidobacterium porcinum]|nr:hypothetical protein BPORC_1013 [Bifidobacterium porcinum]
MFPCEYSEIRSGNVQPDVEAVIPVKPIIHTCPFATPFIAHPTALTQPHPSHAISTSSIPDHPNSITRYTTTPSNHALPTVSTQPHPTASCSPNRT